MILLRQALAERGKDVPEPTFPYFYKFVDALTSVYGEDRSVREASESIVPSITWTRLSRKPDELVYAPDREIKDAASIRLQVIQDKESYPQLFADLTFRPDGGSTFWQDRYAAFLSATSIINTLSQEGGQERFISHDDLDKVLASTTPLIDPQGDAQHIYFEISAAPKEDRLFAKIRGVNRTLRGKPEEYRRKENFTNHKEGYIGDKVKVLGFDIPLSDRNRSFLRHPTTRPDQLPPEYAMRDHLESALVDLTHQQPDPAHAQDHLDLAVAAYAGIPKFKREKGWHDFEDYLKQALLSVNREGPHPIDRNNIPRIRQHLAQAYTTLDTYLMQKAAR